MVDGRDVKVGGVCWGVVMVHLMERVAWGHRGTLCIFKLDETQNNPWL